MDIALGIASALDREVNAAVIFTVPGPARHAVATGRLDASAQSDEVTDAITAVNELLINAARHGGGSGRIRLWARPRLVCEVCNQGYGFAATGYLSRATRPEPPAPSAEPPATRTKLPHRAGAARYAQKQQRRVNSGTSALPRGRSPPEHQWAPLK